MAAATGQDRRQHLLQLTAAGRRKLVGSLPLWEEAQGQFLSQTGTESLQELRALLTAAESAVTKAFTAGQVGTGQNGTKIRRFGMFFAPQGRQEDSAQGFNPGKTSKKAVRPERARDQVGQRRPIATE